MLYRGILDKLIVNGSKITAEVSLLDGNKMTNVEYKQEYGVATLPPNGSDVIVGLVQGGEDNATIIRVEHPEFRPTLAPGEVALYDASGKLLKLDAGGTIPSNTDIIVNGISVETHTHNENDNAPAPTEGPN